MITLTVSSEEPASAFAPTGSAIDQAHLSRMTFGDEGLEREVLQLFARQASLLLARMPVGKPAMVAASAHTLNGSARGIGAWRVALAAEALELAAQAEDESALTRALDALVGAVEEAQAAIEELLQAH